MNNQVLYLLCGLPGTGKTTFAKGLENENCIRYSLDDFFLSKYKDKELTPDQFDAAEQEIKEQIKLLVLEDLKAGKSVILDFGFWKKAERNQYKKFAEESNIVWKLFYFKTDKQTQLDRLAMRNSKDNHKITLELLSVFHGRFEEPSEEGEEIK